MAKHQKFVWPFVFEFHRELAIVKKKIPKGAIAGALLTTAAALLVQVSAKRKTQPQRPLRTVTGVDLNKYTGRWFEIARLPARFEKDCDSDVTATYTLRADGKVDVLNQCRKATGQMKKARGTAKVVDETTNARLKVSFFWPIYGDYWILELGDHYEYTVVGEPSRKYVWILSRSPRMDDGLYQSLLDKIAAQGFDSNRIIKTRHTL